MKYKLNEYREERRIALLGTILTIILFILFLTFVFYKANVEAQKKVDSQLSNLTTELSEIRQQQDEMEVILNEIKNVGRVGHAVSKEAEWDK